MFSHRMERRGVGVGGRIKKAGEIWPQGIVENGEMYLTEAKRKGSFRRKKLDLAQFSSP